MHHLQIAGDSLTRIRNAEFQTLPLPGLGCMRCHTNTRIHMIGGEPSNLTISNNPSRLASGHVGIRADRVTPGALFARPFVRDSYSRGASCAADHEGHLWSGMDRLPGPTHPFPNLTTDGELVLSFEKRVGTVSPSPDQPEVHAKILVPRRDQRNLHSVEKPRILSDAEPDSRQDRQRIGRRAAMIHRR